MQPMTDHALFGTIGRASLNSEDNCCNSQLFYYYHLWHRKRSLGALQGVVMISLRQSSISSRGVPFGPSPAPLRRDILAEWVGNGRARGDVTLSISGFRCRRGKTVWRTPNGTRLRGTLGFLLCSNSDPRPGEEPKSRYHVGMTLGEELGVVYRPILACAERACPVPRLLGYVKTNDYRDIQCGLYSLVLLHLAPTLRHPPAHHKR